MHMFIKFVSKAVLNIAYELWKIFLLGKQWSGNISEILKFEQIVNIYIQGFIMLILPKLKIIQKICSTIILSRNMFHNT